MAHDARMEPLECDEDRLKGTVPKCGEQATIIADYTKWRENLYDGMSVEEVSSAAMEYRKSKRQLE